MRPASEVTT